MPDQCLNHSMLLSFAILVCSNPQFWIGSWQEPHETFQLVLMYQVPQLIFAKAQRTCLHKAICTGGALLARGSFQFAQGLFAEWPCLVDRIMHTVESSRVGRAVTTTQQRAIAANYVANKVLQHLLIPLLHLPKA
jgi:hypothetical protein